MTPQFTPFEPVVWLVFAVFVVCMLVIVKLFHLKYPNYPTDTQKTAASRFVVPVVGEKQADQPSGSLTGQYGQQAVSGNGMGERH